MTRTAFLIWFELVETEPARARGLALINSWRKEWKLIADGRFATAGIKKFVRGRQTRALLTMPPSRCLRLKLGQSG